jgi:hypothetical protein
MLFADMNWGSNEVLDLGGELRPLILDLIPLDVLRHGPKTALIEILRPMGKSNALLKGSKPFLPYLRRSVGLRDHGDRHGKPS